MVFIDTSEKAIVTQIDQIYLRHLRPGQPVELTFKTRPGEIMSGTVETVFDVASGGQALVTGTVATAHNVVSEPFFVRIKPDDPKLTDKLPAGAVGSAAIFTDSATPTHFIRKVMMRMESILNYVNPGLQAMPHARGIQASGRSVGALL